MFDIKDKVVVVTGAVGNLGRSVVNIFLEYDGHVCALDHREGRLEKAFSPRLGNEKLHLYNAVDVTVPDSMAACVEKVLDQVGPVDILVNTVGGFAFGETVHQMTSDTWVRMINLNVMSFFNSSNVIVPGMIEKGGGKIVSIGSKASLKGGAKVGAYAAAKSALLRLTESMADELKDHNIQVNCVIPSTIDGPENRRSMPSADFSKWVKPDEVANVILFLCSKMADAITGAAIPVYGGK
jgi:NAD(P)-dependent dehydrogenase (short-subunit alcohol dehydrogenase family)